MTVTNAKFAPSEADRRWQARVDAARAAVTEAEKAMMATASPAMQTLLYRELREKQRALAEALRAR